jgi:hypothetical protein
LKVVQNNKKTRGNMSSAKMEGGVGVGAQRREEEEDK